MRTRPAIPRLRRRLGQSAVETMLLMPLLVLVVIAMYYLWSIAWASQNAHLRAREYALHGDTYLGGRGNNESGSAPFSGTNYERADSTSFHFSGKSSDRSLPGVGARGEDIDVEVVITSD
ncbi:MAG: hypothetical protein Q8P41_07810 [Pseudomonadota bacterium]|nr:hypothetical protein [Pseudomonadota bacterium]